MIGDTLTHAPRSRRSHVAGVLALSPSQHHRLYLLRTTAVCVALNRCPHPASTPAPSGHFLDRTGETADDELAVGRSISPFPAPLGSSLSGRAFFDRRRAEAS